MKKFVAIALILLIALSLFGCGRMITYDDTYDAYDGAYRREYVTPGVNNGSYNPAINGQYTTGMTGRGYNVTDPVVVPPAR